MDDLALRMASFDQSDLKYSFDSMTEALTINVTSVSAGEFAIDLDGSDQIKSVTAWYAYDQDSVFVDRDGGTFTINLGATPDDVTHITKIADRAELVNITGDGTNLSFSLVGEGHTTIDLVALNGRQATVIVDGVTIPVASDGSTAANLVDDKLDLLLTGLGQHDVSISISTRIGRRASAIRSLLRWRRHLRVRIMTCSPAQPTLIPAMLKLSRSQACCLLSTVAQRRRHPDWPDLFCGYPPTQHRSDQCGVRSSGPGCFTNHRCQLRHHRRARWQHAADLDLHDHRHQRYTTGRSRARLLWPKEFPLRAMIFLQAPRTSTLAIYSRLPILLTPSTVERFRPVHRRA